MSVNKIHKQHAVVSQTHSARLCCSILSTTTTARSRHRRRLLPLLPSDVSFREDTTQLWKVLVYIYGNNRAERALDKLPTQADRKVRSRFNDLRTVSQIYTTSTYEMTFKWAKLGRESIVAGVTSCNATKTQDVRQYIPRRSPTRFPVRHVLTIMTSAGAAGFVPMRMG